jgi:hypothetical protein
MKPGMRAYLTTSAALVALMAGPVGVVVVWIGAR